MEHKKAILCMLKTNVHDHTVYRIQMDELKSLTEALGITVVGEVIQSRYKPFAKFLVGSGKVKDIRKKAKKLDAEIVIFYNILRSSQKLNLIRATDCEVIDRFELTLEIFDRMASDNLSKLQIQSARLEKMAPFFKLQASINYSHDRPFFRSGGEYGFHGQLREISRNQARIREEIEKLMDDKIKRIYNRRKLGYPVICIAGFYNAGKTSLFNAVTGDTKPVSDRPFTTLSSKYQKRFIDYETTVLFIDTIGFVIDLDPRLIQSFKLNLLDMKSSDLVVLLLEITDPILTLQMKLEEGVRLLKSIGVSHDRIIVVFNKLDKNPELEYTVPQDIEIDRYNLPWICISARERMHLQDFLLLIAERLRYMKDNPPVAIEESVFDLAETSVNKIIAEYPVEAPPPTGDPFRSLVSTILSQNTNGRNRAVAFERLEEMVGINPVSIDEATSDAIIEAIKPAGMFNQKAKTLKEVSRASIERFNGDLDSLFNETYLVAREELTQIKGVGPKTADVALLFTGFHQNIPVDRHVERVTKRLGLVPKEAGYEEVQRALQDASAPDRFMDVHLSMVRFGREVCRARSPRCAECPLNSFCPSSTV